MRSGIALIEKERRMRRSPLKSTPKRRSEIEKQAQAAWNENLGECLACLEMGLHTPAQVGHHAILRQRLRRYVETRIYQERLGPGEGTTLMADVCWDTANRVPLCNRHHEKHHDGTAYRLPRACLPDSVYGFAAEHGFEADIERDYAGD